MQKQFRRSMFLSVLFLLTSLQLQAQTENQIPKWTDGLGTLGDSSISEDPTTKVISIGSTSLSGRVHLDNEYIVLNDGEGQGFRQ